MTDTDKDKEDYFQKIDKKYSSRFVELRGTESAQAEGQGLVELKSLTNILLQCGRSVTILATLIS